MVPPLVPYIFFNKPRPENIRSQSRYCRWARHPGLTRMLIWWWHAKHHIVSLWSFVVFFQISKKNITTFRSHCPWIWLPSVWKKVTWHVQPLPLGVPVPASSMTKERQTLSADGFKAKAKLEPHGELSSCIHVHIWYETYQYIWLLSSPDWLQIMHIRYTRYIKVDCANACRTQALQSNNIKSQNKWWKNASSVTIWTPTKLIYNKPCSNLFYEITPYRNAPKTNLGSGLFIAMAVSPSRASSDEIKTWASSHQDLTQHRWSTLQLTNKAMECPHFQ